MFIAVLFFRHERDRPRITSSEQFCDVIVGAEVVRQESAGCEAIFPNHDFERDVCADALTEGLYGVGEDVGADADGQIPGVHLRLFRGLRQLVQERAEIRERL
jgi:hypothetical protein